MIDFDLERLKASPDYPKIQQLLNLLLEARDALPAIGIINARLHGVDLSLADRIEAALEPWEIKE